jgi:hypothetical protein
MMMAGVGRSHSVTGLIGEQTHVEEPRADLSQALVWTLLALCGACYFSQSFSAWAWPALDGYPAIERWLNPDFLPGDLYTNTTNRYGVDTWQAVLFGSFQRLSGVPYALTIAVLTAWRLLVFPAVIYAFLRGLLGKGSAALLAICLAVLANFDLPHTLGWQWLWGDGSPAMFAALTATGAWALVLRRRIWESLLLMAAAAILQPLVAVHGGIVFALVFFLDFDARERWKAVTSPTNLAAGAIFLAAFLSQYVLLSPPPGERLPDVEYLRILVWERHPTDFLPSRFKPPEIAGFFIAATGVLVMLARVWRTLPRRTLIVGALGAYAALCVAGWVFVELSPTRLAADLIPFRTAVFGAPFLLAVIGAFAGQAYQRRNVATLGLLLLAFGTAGPLGKALHFPGFVPAGLLLVAGLAGPGFSVLRLTRLAGAPLWTAVGLALAGQAAVAASHRQAAMVLPTLANQHPVYAWAKAHTAPGAVFLLEQRPSDWSYGLKLSPQHMRLIGRRAVAASMDFPFADRDQRAWLKTWTKGLDHGRRDFIETSSAARLAQVCRDLPFDYLIRVRPLEGQTSVATFAPWRGLSTVQVYRPCPAS